MAQDSVYKVITLVGSSSESWERATAAAIEEASRTLRDLRIARVLEQDVHIEAGNALTYRVRLELSFKYEGGS
jgi:dodecin